MVEEMFWAAIVTGEIALAFVLIHKRRIQHFPAFGCLIAVDILASLVGFTLQQHGLQHWYARTYWAYFPLNILLQLAVLLEIARVVLRPTGTWVRDARKQFFGIGAAGAIIALAMALWVAPPAPDRLSAFEIRVDLFTSLLICELFLAMALTANKLGLGWRNHVMAIGQGLTMWSLAAVMVDSIHSYFGAVHFYISLEYLKEFAYITALCYWCVQLWHEEPARQPISPELRKYIVALHQRVHYDLGEAER